MDKFCVFCGKALEDGTACDCQEKEREETAVVQEEMPAAEEPCGEETVQINVGQAYDGTLPEEPKTETEAPQVQQPVQTGVQIRPQAYMIPRKEPNALGNYWKRCRVIFTQFFVHPMQIMRVAAEKKDVWAGIFFWILCAIVAGLLPAIGMTQLIGRTVGAALMQYIAFPKGWMWFQGFLIDLGQTALLSLLAFAFAKAMHSRASFKNVTAAVGVSCVGRMALKGITLILMLIAPGFGLCFYLLSGGLSLVLLYLAFVQSFAIGQNKTLYCLVIAEAIFAVVITLCLGGMIGDLLQGGIGNLFGGLLR